MLWEQEDFRDGGWQRRECAKLGQAVPGNSDQRAAPSTVGAKVSISGACLAGRHTLSLFLRLCVCVLSVLPSLAAVIRHRLDFSRTKSQQRPRRWLWGRGTRSPGEEPVSEAPTLLLASIPLPPQASTSMLPSRCLPHLSLRKGELTISPAMSTSFLGDILRAGACPSLGR